jgi:pyridoxal 4-dehydrogenase
VKSARVLDGHLALITGGAHGIGASIVSRLECDGARVVVADLTSPSQDSGWPVLSCDVTREGEIQALADQVHRDFGAPDILVNNAGIYPVGALEETSLEEWRRVMAVNLDSVFLMSRTFVPAMKQNHFGRIVNIASNTFHAGIFPNYSAYVASKGGVIGFTRALASELGPHGITVNAIAPGLVATDNIRANRTTHAIEAVRLEQAIPQTLQAGDIAGTAAFLARPDSVFITGQTLVVDGGLARV